MIIQRLCEAAARFDFPPFGYQVGPVKWIVDLDARGRLVGPGFVETSSDGDKGRDRGKPMAFPFVHRSSGVASQLLADKASYALGLPNTDADERQVRRTGQCLAHFTRLVEECVVATGLDSVQAVVRFLRAGLAQTKLPEDLTPDQMVTFRVDGDLLIDNPAVRQFWADYTATTREDRTTEEGVCLVCGRRAGLADRMPIPIKRVPGGQSSGCALVSANAAAFESLGRTAALISPICWQCGAQHAQVLNAMLADPDYSLRVQDRMAFVFWTRSPSSFSMSRLLSTPDPADVKRLLNSVYRPIGGAALEDDAFYTLALSGSAARVVIRDWFETTLENATVNLSAYFQAQAISGGGTDQDGPLGVKALATSLIPSVGKDPWKAMGPDWVAAMVNTALLGRPLPPVLLQAAVGRARAEQGLTRARAAVIKMCLLLSANREEGFDVKEELNPQIEDPAYLCGRLLAVLESIQATASNRKAKATLIDRFYGTASSAPASVFGTLLRLSQAHLRKLRLNNKGAYVRLQESLEGITAQLPPTFPSSLRLIDQGKFALGYYQQRAADHAARNEAIAAKQAKEENDESQEEETNV